jgi:heme exporter protein A
MTAWAIETRDLTKRYGYRQILGGVDLCVKPGEFVVLFGPNGAGKSTLIRILCTLMQPSSGTAKVAGCDIVEAPDRVRANIGLIGHSTYLYDDLSAVENLRFYLRMGGVEAIEQRLADALKRLGTRQVQSGEDVLSRHEKAAVHRQDRCPSSACPVFG